MNDNISGADLLAQINPRLPEKGTGICLRPDLLTEWEDLNDQLTASQVTEAASNQRLASSAAKVQKDLAQQVTELEEQIEASEVRFVLRAMPKDRFQALCEENPPRKDDQIDLMVGYNRVAVSDQSVRICLVSPTFEDCTKVKCEHTDCGSWQQFIAVCNPGEWQELRNTAEEVNGAAGGAPKSRLASRILGKAESTSRPRAAGE